MFRLFCADFWGVNMSRFDQEVPYQHMPYYELQPHYQQLSVGADGLKLPRYFIDSPFSLLWN
jgi:hypothetical protein